MEQSLHIYLNMTCAVTLPVSGPLYFGREHKQCAMVVDFRSFSFFSVMPFHLTTVLNIMK